MGVLQGRRILIGVTGGIAAYKSALLVRLLKREGAEVRVVMTAMAKEFITPLALATLSGNPIAVEFFDPTNGQWHSHVSLGQWAEAMVIAPATANTLAKMAHGIADNLLCTTYLSARCEVVVAPAMDLDMYAHASTQQNLATLKARGVHVVDPDEGFLASGLEGKGRMAEPETIVEQLRTLLPAVGALHGKRVLVTLGPTVEAIDPVRHISNRSSGRMGSAIVEALLARGAAVECVAGPAKMLPRSAAGLTLRHVTSAEEMLNACLATWDKCNAGIMVAAVGDYRVNRIASQKLHRTADAPLTLELIPNADIAATLGKKKQPGQLLVGFALETHDALTHAAEKMEKKNLDLCVLNSLEDQGAGFETSTNVATLMGRDGSSCSRRSLESKESLAEAIADWLTKRLSL